MKEQNKQNAVLLDIKDRVAHITLNRPDKHNAFDGSVIDRLMEIMDTIEEEEDLVAAILRGKGKSFSAGADLSWMKKAVDASEEENRQGALRLSRVLNKLNTLPVVTIACVQGAAMGGGLGLVACCDIVIAQENAIFSFSEVQVGLIPATISPYVLNTIGQRQARRYFQTGEKMSPARAQEMDLVHEVVLDDDAMNEQLETLLRSIRTNGPSAMKQAKQLCLDYAGKTVTEEVIKDTADRIAQARVSAEAQEGIQAFLEDRKPDWGE